jgi:hypothetical protein
MPQPEGGWSSKFYQCSQKAGVKNYIMCDMIPGRHYTEKLCRLLLDTATYSAVTWQYAVKCNPDDDLWELQGKYMTHIFTVSEFLSLIWYPLLVSYVWLLTELLTLSRVQDILWKSDSHSAHQTVARFLHGTRRFITILRKVRHWTLSWSSRIQFISLIPIILRSVLVLSSLVCVGLPSLLFPSDLPTKTL